MNQLIEFIQKIIKPEFKDNFNQKILEFEFWFKFYLAIVELVQNKLNEKLSYVRIKFDIKTEAFDMAEETLKAVKKEEKLDPCIFEFFTKLINIFQE